MKNYRTVKEQAEAEFVEKKSTFIGSVKRVFSEEEARAFIAEVKGRFKEARHHVFAYTIGEDMQIQRYSDDGEPQGTGGIPVLEVIRKNELRYTCIVVTRYFGGILLGAAGLTRAYVRGAVDALAQAGSVERVLGQEVMVETEYDLLGKIEHYLREHHQPIEHVEYTDKVLLQLYLPSEKTSQVMTDLTNLTAGRAILTAGEEELFYQDEDGLQKGFEEQDMK